MTLSIVVDYTAWALALPRTRMASRARPKRRPTTSTDQTSPPPPKRAHRPTASQHRVKRALVFTRPAGALPPHISRREMADEFLYSSSPAPNRHWLPLTPPLSFTDFFNSYVLVIRVLNTRFKSLFSRSPLHILSSTHFRRPVFKPFIFLF